MKYASSITSALLIATALALPVLTTGCASTQTQASLGETVDDTVLTTRVKAAFVEDKAVHANDISVETYKGTVQLSGFAVSEHEAARAAEIARKVPGVKAVKNDIRLRAAQ